MTLYRTFDLNINPSSSWLWCSNLRYSATSFFRFRGSTPFEIARGSYAYTYVYVYGQQHNSYSHKRKFRRNRSVHVRRGARGKYSM